MNPAEIGPGMVILRVENVPVAAVKDFDSAIAKHPQGIRLLVLARSGMQRFYYLGAGEEAK